MEVVAAFRIVGEGDAKTHVAVPMRLWQQVILHLEERPYREVGALMDLIRTGTHFVREETNPDRGNLQKGDT